MVARAELYFKHNYLNMRKIKRFRLYESSLELNEEKM